MLKKMLALLMSLMLCAAVTLPVTAEEGTEAYDVLRVESLGTMDPPLEVIESGEDFATIYCVDGYLGAFSFEKGEENRENLGFGEEDWVRLVLKDDGIFLVPADVENDPVENIQLDGAEAFAAWWTEQVEGKEYADSMYFLFTLDENDYVTVLEYYYLP